MRRRVIAFAVLFAALSPVFGQMRFEPFRPPEQPRNFNPGCCQNFNNPQQNPTFNNPNLNLNAPTVNGPTGQGESNGTQGTGEERPALDRAADELDTIDINELPCIKKIGRVL